MRAAEPGFNKLPPPTLRMDSLHDFDAGSSE